MNETAETDEKIADLRGRLARAAPGERLDLLIDLGAELTRDAISGGVGAPAAALIGEAIDVQRQALELAPAADPRVASLHWWLGNLYAIRFVNLGGPQADRDAAIELFDAYVTWPDVQEERRQVAGVWLGILLMMRVMRLPAVVGGAIPDAYDLLPLMFGLQLSAESAADLRKAVSVLERFADADVEPRLQRMAAALHALAMLFQASQEPGEGGADMSHALALLSKAGAALFEGDEGRAEILGLNALLRADRARASGTPDPTVVEDLQKAIELVPYGHLLHSTLQHELGLAYAESDPRTRSEDDLLLGAHFLEAAHAEMAVRGAEHPLYEDGLRQLAGALVTSNAMRPTPDGVEKVVSLAEDLLSRREPADVSDVAKDTYLLGMALTLRARLTGRQDDWTKAADRLRHSLELVPDDDPLAVTMLTTFGALLNDRHLVRGDLDDAEAAPFYLARAQAIQAARSRGGQRPGPAGAGAGAVDHDLLVTMGLCGVTRIAAARRHGDVAALDLAVREIQTALDGLPETYAWRSRLLMGRGMALMARGILRRDATEIHDGIVSVREADNLAAIDTGSRTGLSVAGGVALVADGFYHSDGVLLRRGIEKLTEAVGSPTTFHGERARFLCALGNAHLICRQVARAAGRHDEATDQLELGIARLEQARGLFAESGDPNAADALWQLATAYRIRADAGRDDPNGAIESGLLALRARTSDVLLQSGAEHALITARGAAAMAQAVARWCLELDRPADAVEAIELGRGLVLHAATSATIVPELLREAGHGELAEAWETHDAGASGSWRDGSAEPVGMPGAGMPLPLGALGGSDEAERIESLGRFALSTLAQEAPNDLRQRVLAVLHEHATVGVLLTPPSIEEIGAALRTVGADGLVYLLPGGEDEPGRLLTMTGAGRVASIQVDGLRVDEAGPVRSFAALVGAAGEGDGHAEPDERRRRLEELCEWAWPRGIQPLLEGGWGTDPARPSRLVLVPSGELGVVPWHAARTTSGGGPTYACARLVLSYAPSARQLVDVAGRPPIPLNDDPVFVADPTEDLTSATEEAVLLRGAFYRAARGFGATGRVEESRLGTPERVLACMPGRDTRGASLLQLSGHALMAATPERSHLVLDDAKPLPVADILRRSHGRPGDAPGGLVVLSNCESDLTGSDYDEALTLATAFLSAGAVSVVGARWQIAGRPIPLLMYMFHRALVVDGLRPVDALRAAQLWMLDPRRPIPAELPPAVRADVSRLDLADPTVWAAFTHQGR